MTRAQEKVFGWAALLFGVMCTVKWLGITYAPSEFMDVVWGAFGFFAAWVHLKRRSVDRTAKP